MAVGDSLLEKVDAYLAELFAGWNFYSTLIATALFIFLAYPWLTWRDPDTHPLLLARQASASPVRQPGESAIYRSLESPHGYPLRAGLGVKDPGAPRWSSGRNGDLRDIWRQAVRGVMKEDGTLTGEKGKIFTVLGREKVIQHPLEDISQEINVIGQYVNEAKGKTVAICLSNSVELLSAIFAAAFYGFKPVLVPHNLSTESLIAHLRQAQPEVLIAEAGSVELAPVVSACPILSHVVWVVQHGSRHMDWSEVPEGIGGRVDVAVWHELVEEKKASVTSRLPDSEKDSTVGPLATFWPTDDGKGKMVEYSSEKNIIAAVAALISVLPRNHRLSASDVFVPVDSLSYSYPLALTFAALYSNASVVLNSVAGDDVDLTLAVSGIAPTIIAASSNTLSRYHQKDIAPQVGLLTKFSRWSHARVLDAGNMPDPQSLSSAGITRPAPSSKMDKLRLIFACHRIGVPKSTELSSENLEDLRIFTGARVAYAFTAAPVAGAVAQTSIYDYRKTADKNHVGPPLSSLEVKLVGGDEKAAENSVPNGKIVVEGPAVVGGSANLGIDGHFRNDNTLALS